MTTITVKRYGIYERRSGSIAACREIDLRRTPHLAVMEPGYSVSAETGKLTTDDTESQNDLVREIVVSEAYHPWNGGDNPSPERKVEVIYRDGSRSRGYSADFSWRRRNAGDDIVAFRPCGDSSLSALALQADIGKPSPQFFESKIPAKLREGLPERIMLERVANGSFIITDDCGIPGRINSVLAALSSEQDLLFWLTGKSPSASAAVVEKGVAP